MKLKKLLFGGLAILIALSASLTASAQTAPNAMLSTPTHVPTDTVVNAAVKYQYTPAISGYADVLTFQFVITKISGTVGGSVLLQGTLDGTNYINIGSAVTATDVATQSASFVLTSHSYIKYRISYTGVTGPMSAKINSYWIARKRT